MRTTSGTLAGVQAMLGAFDEFGHQLEDLHTLESLCGVVLSELEAAVTLSRIVMREEVDLIFRQHLTPGALVARLPTLCALAFELALTLLFVLLGVGRGSKRRVRGVEAKEALELVEACSELSILCTEPSILGFEFGDALVAWVNGVGGLHASRLTSSDELVNLFSSAFFRQPAERLQTRTGKKQLKIIQ